MYGYYKRRRLVRLASSGKFLAGSIKGGSYLYPFNGYSVTLLGGISEEFSKIYYIYQTVCIIQAHGSGRMRSKINLCSWGRDREMYQDHHLEHLIETLLIKQYLSFLFEPLRIRTARLFAFRTENPMFILCHTLSRYVVLTLLHPAVVKLPLFTLYSTQNRSVLPKRIVWYPSET